MPTSAELLELAIAHHRAGRLDLAEQAYTQLRRENPDHPDALHLLGVIAHQRGDAARAVTLIRQAIAVRPGVAAIHGNLAEALRASGDLAGSIEHGRKALELDPGFHPARGNLALALTEAGRLDEAVAELEHALAANERDALAHNNLGNALRLLHRENDALKQFRRAVELEPASAEFQSNLGQMLLELGHIDEAEQHCRNAVRLAPNLASARSNLGNVLREQRRLDEAMAEYQAALRLKPDVALFHNNLGQALQDAGGRLADAMRCYDAAIKLDPRSARAISNLAGALDEADQPEQARQLYAHALSVDPDWPEACLGIAMHLRNDGDLTGAREHLNTAIAAKPRYALAHSALAGICNELGEFEQARLHARQALAADPSCTAAIAALSASYKDKLPDADLQMAAAILERRKYLNEGSRSTLHYVLGAACDARGQYEPAARHFEEANALCKAGWVRYRGGYSPEQHKQFVDAMMAAFSAAHFARARDFGHESELPVFVLGLPRSGTTLIEQILASHPQVHGAGELRLVRETFDSVLLSTGSPDDTAQRVQSLDEAQWRALAQQHLRKLEGLSGGKARVVDKMPDNYLYLGFIATLFGRAKIIHCRRDLRDTALSSWQTHFTALRWASDQDWILHRYRQYARIMDHWRRVLPGHFLEVHYENTVEDLAGTAREIVAWAGLPWDDRCLNFHETARPVRTASLAQVRQPIYTRSKGRYVNYEPWLGEWFAKLAVLERPAQTDDESTK